jgi:hypothetical protein
VTGPPPTLPGDRQSTPLDTELPTRSAATRRGLHPARGRLFAWRVTTTRQGLTGRSSGASNADDRRAIEDNLRYYLRRAVSDRVGQQPSATPGAAEPDAIVRYRRACAQLSTADRDAMVATIELGYSYQQLALLGGLRSPRAAKAMAERALLRLVRTMGGSAAASRSVSALASAVLDAEAVDWERAAARADLASVPLVRSLETVDRIAAASRSGRSTATPATTFSWTSRVLPPLVTSLVLLAAVHVAVAIVGYTEGVAAPTGLGPSQSMLTTLVFAASSVWLGLGGRGDPRARSLAVSYLLTSAAFARRFLPDSSLGAMATLLRSACPDAFLAVFLWRFVGQFPRRVRFGPAERTCRDLEGLSLAAGLFLFLVNGLLGFGLLPSFDIFERSRPPFLYWAILFALVVPALPVAWLRARTAPPNERRRLALFTLGLGVGTAPIVLSTLAGAIVPGAWTFIDADSYGQTSVFGAFLLLIPCVTGYSVLVHNVLDVRVVVGRAFQYVFAKVTLTLIAVLPFVMLAGMAYFRRDLSLAQVLGSSGAVALLVLPAAGIVMWAARGRVLRLLDRRFLRTAPDVGADLYGLLAAMQRAGGQGEVIALLETRLSALLQTEAVTIVDWGPSGVFSGVGSSLPSLSVRSAVGALLAARAGPLLVDPHQPGTCFGLLPPDERDWIVRTQAGVVVPLLGSGAIVGLLVAASRRNGVPYAEGDLALLATLAPAAALALEARTVQGSGQLEAAAECIRCGRVGASIAQLCECGSPRQAARLPPVVADKFRVDRRVGAGGMGVVYRGEDIALKRTVALKTLPALSPGAGGRLAHEARVMASVIHPNLATVYTLEHWQRTPVLVEEFLDGGTLSARLKTGPQPIGGTLQLGIVLAGALQHLHDAGVLHRDVKPGNIGFTRADVPKLLDFGLASMLSDVLIPGVGSDAIQSPATATQSIAIGGRQVAGTPIYLSPEAAMGRAPHADFDLWALAMVLYEAIAGRHPFAGAALDETFAMVRAARVPNLGQFRPDCPQAVCAAFGVMLARDRHARPRTATELRQLIERCTNDQTAGVA